MSSNENRQVIPVIDDIRMEKARRSYKELILEKIGLNFIAFDIVTKLKFDDPPKGFNRKDVKFDQLDLYMPRLQCGLCEHVVILPKHCTTCKALHCGQCIKFLEKLPIIFKIKPCQENEFVCLNKLCLRKEGYRRYEELDKSMKEFMGQLKYKCRRQFCDDTHEGDYVLRHEASCKKGPICWTVDPTVLLYSTNTTGEKFKGYLKDHPVTLQDILRPDLSPIKPNIVDYEQKYKLYEYILRKYPNRHREEYSLMIGIPDGRYDSIREELYGIKSDISEYERELRNLGFPKYELQEKDYPLQKITPLNNTKITFDHSKREWNVKRNVPDTFEYVRQMRKEFPFLRKKFSVAPETYNRADFKRPLPVSLKKTVTFGDEAKKGRFDTLYPEKAWSNDTHRRVRTKIEKVYPNNFDDKGVGTRDARNGAIQERFERQQFKVTSLPTTRPKYVRHDTAFRKLHKTRMDEEPIPWLSEPGIKEGNFNEQDAKKKDEPLQIPDEKIKEKDREFDNVTKGKFEVIGQEAAKVVDMVYEISGDEHENDWHFEQVCEEIRERDRMMFASQLSMTSPRPEENLNSTFDWPTSPTSSVSTSIVSVIPTDTLTSPNGEKGYILRPTWEEGPEAENAIREFEGYFEPKRKEVLPTEMLKDKKRRQNRVHLQKKMKEGFEKRVQIEDLPLNSLMEKKLAEGRASIKESELPIIALAVECVTVGDVESYGKPKPIWVAIVNHRCEVIYETLIKQRGIRMMHTELHGLTEKDLTCAMHAPAAQMQLLKFLTSAKIIVGSGIYNHLINFGLTTADAKKFLTKMRDTSYYFTPQERTSCNLAACSFLRFGKEVISLDKHSPVMTARVAMKMYLSDRINMEREANRLNGINHTNLHRMRPHPGILEELKVRCTKKAVDGEEFWPASYINALNDKYALRLPNLEIARDTPKN